MPPRRRRLRLAVRLVLLAIVLHFAVQGCRSVLRTPEPAPARPDPASWSDDGVHVAYLGHASVLLSLRGTTILTDPAFFDRVGLDLGLFTIGPKRLVAPALPVEELPPIDAVVVSHAHMDSLDRPSLRAVDAPLLIVPERTADLVDDLGYGRVVELAWGKSARVGEVEVEAFEVSHWGRRWPWGDRRGYNGYVFRRDGVAILFASDTAYTKEIGRQGESEALTAAIIGNGAYDPWIWNHADPEQVWRMFRESDAPVLIPIHWDTFALGKEPRGDAMRRLLRAAGGEADRIAIDRIGETWSLAAQR